MRGLSAFSPRRIVGRLLRAVALAAALAVAGAGGAAAQGPGAAGGDAAKTAPVATPQATEAEQSALDGRLDLWDRTASSAEQALAEGEAANSVFEALRGDLATQRAEAATAAERLRAATQPLDAQLKALGATEGEGARPEKGLGNLRSELEARIAALESRARRADLAHARADSLAREIDELIRRRQIDEILALGPSPLHPSAWKTALAQSAAVLQSLAQETLAIAQARVERGALRLGPAAMILVALALALMWGVRHGFARARRRLGLGATRGRRALAAALALAARLAAPILSIVLLRAAAAEAEVLGPTSAVLADNLATGLTGLATGHAIAYAWFSPDTPELRLSVVDDRRAAKGAARATLLAAALMLHLTLVRAGEALDLPASALAVGNFLLLLLGAAAMWRLAAVLTAPTPATAAAEAAEAGERPEPDDDGHDDDPLAESLKSAAGLGERLEGLGAFALRAVALASPALAAAGYYAASQRLFYPTVSSTALIGAGLILYSLLHEGIEAWLEKRTGDGGGLRLVGVFFGFVIVAASLPLLALIWGARSSDLLEAWRLASEGVQIGDTTVTPMGFISFLAVFFAGLGLTRLLQAVMASSVLPNTRLDAGARSAITTGIGWTGLAAAALLGISAAGLDLSNIAIVFGALSVGIGFGLQSIASNFVSGVILMIERPVKVGDWILVGGTHGVVKRVSVRATEIETFDRTALIVPNSELISGRVTNYTHNNSVGRLILKAPVAYGTDLKEARRILLEIARKDRRVLRYPAAVVIMAGFGDSAVQLELRVILRDVNQIFEVQTDIYFEIDRRFREAGIEIPYSQSVITVKEPEHIAEALGFPALIRWLETALEERGLAHPAQRAETPRPPEAPPEAPADDDRPEDERPEGDGEVGARR